MKKCALVLLIAGCVAQVQAAGMTIEQARTRIAKVQAQRDASSKQLREIDAKIERLKTELQNTASTPENEEKTQNLNIQLKEAIAQHGVLAKQNEQVISRTAPEITAIGRKHHVEMQDGKWSVVDHGPTRTTTHALVSHTARI